MADAPRTQLRVGRLTKAHGLKGAIKLELYTDDPERRFVPGAEFSLQVPESSPWYGKHLTLRELRWYNGHPVGFFEGVEGCLDQGAGELGTVAADNHGFFVPLGEGFGEGVFHARTQVGPVLEFFAEGVFRPVVRRRRHEIGIVQEFIRGHRGRCTPGLFQQPPVNSKRGAGPQC